MPRKMISAFTALAFAALAGCEAPKAPDQWSPISVTTTPIPLNTEQPSYTEAGELRYRGGLVLKSTSALFGGFSGMSVAPDGRRFISQSDTGVWLTGELQLDANGGLIGVSNARIAQMRDEKGEPLQGKVASDAEDLARLPDGRYAVSFEQNHRILIYDLDGKGPFAPAEKGPVVGGTAGMHPNEGLEALASLPDGTLVAIAEHAPRGSGSPFWLWPPGAAVASPIGRANRPAGYGVSGLATMPNGDLLSVERLYIPFIGVRVNVRHIPAANLRKSPPVADGQVIGVLEPPMNLDNFEAIAVAAGENEGVRIYLISDDNFSVNQRTLLLAFDWTPPASARPAATTAVASPVPVEASATLPPGPATGPDPVLSPPPPAAPTPVKTVAATPFPAKPSEATRGEQAAAAPPPKPKPRPKPQPEPEPPLIVAPLPPRPSAGPPA